MRVGFDAKRLFNNFTGLGNYSRFIVGALSEFDPASEFYLFSPKVRAHPDVDPLVSRKNVHVVTPPQWNKSTRTTTLWRSWLQSYDPSMKELDVFHGLSHELPWDLPSRVKKVVTIHDLIFLRFPKLYNPIDVAIYKAKAKSACATADKVIAISEQTKTDLEQMLHVDPSKIEVVYQGVHPIFHRIGGPHEMEQIRVKYKLPSRYILSVGTIEERKNAATLIRAVSAINVKERLPLVLVGRATGYKAELQQLIHELSMQDWIVFVQGVDFVDLPAIYRGCSVFVYPSIFEGFGIPLVEAIASNVPVITSTGSCFREAAGPTSLYVDPKDYSGLAKRIVEVLSDQSLRKRMIHESAEYIQQFLPARIAARLMSVYQSVIG